MRGGVRGWGCFAGENTSKGELFIGYGEPLVGYDWSPVGYGESPVGYGLWVRDYGLRVGVFCLLVKRLAGVRWVWWIEDVAVDEWVGAGRRFVLLGGFWWELFYFLAG